MRFDCTPCQEISGFEQELDGIAERLVKRVNELCAPVRERNKERWEYFANKVQIPFIGNIIYRVFHAPKGLEQEPHYRSEEWYITEVEGIELLADKLEEMKAAHMEHFGQEKVYAEVPGDYRGENAHFRPENPMTREQAYQTYNVRGEETRLLIFVPSFYDFVSAAGGDKLSQGRFVMDGLSKQVVPES